MTRKELDTLWFQAMRQSIEGGEDFVRYHFAALVAEREREACAKVCEDYTDRYAGCEDEGHGYEIAAAVRARGEP